jgi:hypothetical protein
MSPSLLVTSNHIRLELHAYTRHNDLELNRLCRLFLMAVLEQLKATLIEFNQGGHYL